MNKEEQEAIENYENDLKLAEKYGCFITKTKLADELLRVCKKQKADINKLINYIAVRENKDYEDIRKEFDI